MLLFELPIVMIRCLVFTIIIELAVAFVIGIKEKKDYLNILLVNIATNPLVVVLPVVFEIQCGREVRVLSLVLLEFLAFLFEGFVYFKCLKYKKTNGFLVSLILNMSSYLLGEMINYLIYK